MSHERELLGLLGPLYEAATDASLWEAFLDELDFKIVLGDTLKALLPHLARAREIQRRVADLALRNDLLTSAVDRLEAGVVLFDGRATPAHVNRAAGTILASGDGLSLVRDALEASSRETTALLRRFITGAAGTGDGNGQDAGGVVRVTRPSGKRAYQVIVTPLPGRRTAAAAVFITDPEHRIAATTEELQSLFGLTRAESTLCLRLVNGLNVEEAAEELGITLSTARSHLAKIFAKTETNRQSQLVGLLVRSAALIDGAAARAPHSFHRMTEGRRTASNGKHRSI